MAEAIHIIGKLKYSILIISFIVLILSVLLLSKTASAAPCTQITELYFAYDDSGVIHYPQTPLPPANVPKSCEATPMNIILAVAGNCNDGDSTNINIYDTVDGTTPGTRWAGPMTVYFFNGVAIKSWAPGSSVVGKRLLIVSGTRVSTNTVIVSDLATCHGGDVQTGSPTFEPCDRSAGETDFSPANFFDSSNLAFPYFDGGMKQCISAENCVINTSHACGLDSATLTTNCAGTCESGKIITITGTKLRRTPNSRLSTSAINCRLEPPEDKVKVKDLQSTCEFEVTVTSEPNYISGPTYDLHPSFTLSYTIPNPIPAACQGKRVTEAVVNVYTDNTPGSVLTKIANATVMTNIEFGISPVCSVNTYFAKRVGSNYVEYNDGENFAAGEAYICVEPVNCPEPNNVFNIDIYDTDNGATTDGFVEHSYQSVPLPLSDRECVSFSFPRTGWPPPLQTGLDEAGSSDVAGFSNQDPTTEYMISVTGAASALSSNYIEAQITCGSTPLYTCQVAGGAQTGFICMIYNGAPQLRPNCAGQSYPSNPCTCGTGSCTGAYYPYAFVDFEPGFNIDNTKKHDEQGAVAQVYLSDNVHSGSQSLRYLMQNIASGNSYSVYILNFSSLASGQYTASAYVNTNKQNFARIYGKSSGWTEPPQANSSWHSASNKWEKLLFTFNGNNNYNIMMEVKGQQGEAYFDDVQLLESTQLCAAPGSECHIDTVSITSECLGGTCGPNEKIKITGTYSGIDCPPQVVMQVDARDNPLYPSCAIEKTDSFPVGPNGYIRGMNVICSGEVCNGYWYLPETIPINCIGKTVMTTSAGLYRMGGAYLGYGSPSGQFTFNHRPRVDSITALPSLVTYGMQVTITGHGADDADNDRFRLECGQSELSSNLCIGNYGTSHSPVCTFNSPWNDNNQHTIYCRVFDGNFTSSPDSTVVVTSDNIGEIVQILSPVQGSWQSSPSFTVSVDWASSSSCRYHIRSNGVLTRNISIDCGISTFDVTVGATGYCRDVGQNKCAVEVIGYDQAGNAGSDSKTYSISFGVRSLDVLLTPAEIGGTTTYVIAATAASDAGLKNITFNITTLSDTYKQVYTYTTYVPSDTKQVSRQHPAGTRVNYWVNMTDNALQSIKYSSYFDICALTSASMSASCTGGKCWSGNDVTINIAYTGMCPATSYIKVYSESSDSRCTIWPSGGDMSGIQFTCTSGTCTGRWTIPSTIPADCYGKTVSPTHVVLLQGGYSGAEFHTITPPIATGSFTFAYPPGSCEVEGGAVMNNTCALKPSRPDYCDNGILKKRGDICGCNDGFWMLENITQGSDTQYDCVAAVCGDYLTDYLTCEVTGGHNTGLFCDGVPRGSGTNIIENLTLFPNAVGQHSQPACSCPPGEDAASMPYWNVYQKNFEEQENIIFENLDGSTGSRGIFPPGYSSEYALYITKTNGAGESRALLPFYTEINERYTVKGYVSTSSEHFAKIYDLETGSSSPYSPGETSWNPPLQYMFDALYEVHNIALSVSGAASTAAFDTLQVKKHDMLCTAICIDGTPAGQCSVGGWGKPYYCDRGAPEYPNLIRKSSLCGCPPGNESDGFDGCVDVSCHPDGTPYGECSETLTGIWDNFGGDHGILFCTGNGTWEERPDICGCGDGYGYDPVADVCVDCEGEIEPPIGGYAECEATGGTLSREVTVENLTCITTYDCDCPPDKIFDIGFGCVSTCDINNICEPFESPTSCPLDCPIDWTAVSTSVTDRGTHFEGDIDITFLLGFRSCKGSANPLECRAVPLEQCSINSTCLCGDPFTKACNVICHDKRDVFYLLGEGTYLPPGNPFGAQNVIIGSDVYNFSCPVFHMDQLNQHLQNFIFIRQSAFIGLEQAMINLQNAETEEERQHWQQQINIFNEVLIVAQAHIEYLQDVIEGVNEGDYGIEKVTEAFDLTYARYQEILDIVAGRVTIFSMDILYPEIVELPQGESVEVNITALVSSDGNATRYAKSSCMLTDPNSSTSFIKSNCTIVEPNTDANLVMSKNMSKYGTWTINYCSLNVSMLSSCASSMEFIHVENIGTINITQLALLRIVPPIDVPSGEMSVGQTAKIKVNVENIDVVEHTGFVSCTIKDPDNKLNTTSSLNKTVPAISSVLFEPSFVVTKQGTWTVISCTVYRIGSIINEGTFIINQNFEVGPPDFILSPSEQSGSISPGGSIVYNITLKNTGLSSETYTTNLSTTNNWSATYTINKTGQLVLNKGESATIFVTVSQRLNETNTLTTLVVTSVGAGRTKTSYMRTNISFPNRAPVIILNEIPETVLQNATITFSADITDPESDTISARACIVNCINGCQLVKTGTVYTCNYMVRLPMGTYTYFVNATDGKDIAISDSYSMRVVPEGYCEGADDCDEDQECKNHVCTDVVTCPSTKSACYVSSDGQSCIACNSEQNCISGVCRKQSECSRDDDCSGDRICRENKCVVSFAGTCGDSICSTGENCPADCGGEESPMFLILAIIIVIIVFVVLVLYIRKRREEEEEEY